MWGGRFTCGGKEGGRKQRDERGEKKGGVGSPSKIYSPIAGQNGGGRLVRGVGEKELGVQEGVSCAKGLLFKDLHCV